MKALCSYSVVKPFAIGVFAVLSIALAANAQDYITTVEDSAFSDKNRRQPIVAFEHDAHNYDAGIQDCSTCHHYYENGKKLPNTDSVGMECSACHLSQPEDEPMDLIRAYHLQCQSCHLENKAGPILCGQCHSKKE